MKQAFVPVSPPRPGAGQLQGQLLSGCPKGILGPKPSQPFLQPLRSSQQLRAGLGRRCCARLADQDDCSTAGVPNWLGVRPRPSLCGLPVLVQPIAPRCTGRPRRAAFRAPGPKQGGFGSGALGSHGVRKAMDPQLRRLLEKVLEHLVKEIGRKRAH